MNQKKKFRSIIEEAASEMSELAPWFKANLDGILGEFDENKKTHTFHGVYKFLEEVEERAEKNGDFFIGYEFYQIEELQMEREVPIAQKVDLKLSIDGKEVAAGRTSLGGEAVWSQNRDHPVCPECDSNMALVFQLDSLAQISENKKLKVQVSRDDYAFGDVGIVRFFRCVDCNEFHSNWECG